MSWERVLTGIDFGEGPRWHDGRLWFSDFYQHTISSVGDDGERQIEHRVGDDVQPSGLGWLPDGRLLFVSMLDRRLMRVEADGTIVEHADMSGFVADPCNDMVVDELGNAYVGNFGFDLPGGARPATTDILLVRPDGTVQVGASRSMFPNGSVIVDNTLVVGETFGGTYTAYDIAPDATLGAPRQWADVRGTSPDGCTMDADGAIWFSDASGGQVVRVHQGGTITATITTPQPTYACMLGGDDGRTLYVLTCADSHPDNATGTATGELITTRVDVPKHPTALP